MMNKNQKIALAVSILIPIVVLLVVLFLVIAPIGKANPTTDFIYSMGPFDTGNGNVNFQVKDNKLVVIETKYATDPNFGAPKRLVDGKEVLSTIPEIFYHDVIKNESHKITLDEAKILTLDASLKSEDGYKVERIYGRGGSVWPIPSPYYDSRGYSGNGEVYLTKDSLSKEMEVKQPSNTGGYYYQDFSFIAWVTK